MKNFEKHIDDIVSYINNSRCHHMDCDECIFNKRDEYDYCIGDECNKYKLKQWLLAEYKEPCPLSHDEYVILKNVDSKYKWIVRHDNGNNLWLFVNKPTKEGYCIWVDLEEYDDEEFEMFNHLFQFIQWEDEPCEISKLLADYEKEKSNE